MFFYYFYFLKAHNIKKILRNNLKIIYMTLLKWKNELIQFACNVKERKMSLFFTNLDP